MNCPECGGSMENVGANPSQLPEWVCKNLHCLRSVYHRERKCPKCGKSPAEITLMGNNFTNFLCEDGHAVSTPNSP